MPGHYRAHGQQETAKGYRRTRVTEVSGTACYFTVYSTLLVFANRFFVFTPLMGSAKVVHPRACPLELGLILSRLRLKMPIKFIVKYNCKSLL